MLNSNFIVPKITEYISEKLFHAIVTECFLSALPFGDIDSDTKSRLGSYSMSVMESFIFPSGEKTAFGELKNRMENERNQNRKYFYQNLYNICTESACKASKRISSSKDNQNKTLEQLLAESGLNEDELKEFKENIASVNIDNIAEVINNKVIDTIKDEQKQIQDSDDLNRKLNEAISPEPSEDEYADNDYDSDSDESDDKNDDGNDDLDDNSMIDGEELEATEGFLSNWKEKRLTREMDISDINRMDENIYCEMVGEYVLSSFNDKKGHSLIDDPSILKSILTFENFDIVQGESIPKFNTDIEINYVTSRTNVGSVTIAQWYHPLRRKNVYAYATIRTSYKNTNPAINDILKNENNYEVTVYTRKDWNKKLLDFYRRNYKSKTMGTAQESINRFYSINFDGTSIITPISFFGKLNDYAIESCISVKESEDTEIPYDALEKTTYYSNLPFIEKRVETIEDAYESLLTICTEALDIPNNVAPTKPETLDMSILVSTIIYTILETLKTIGLYNPSSNDIRMFVDSKTNYDSKSVMNVAKEQVTNKVKDIRSKVSHTDILNTKDADIMLESLSVCKNIIDRIQEHSLTESKLIKDVEALESLINTKISTSKLIPTERVSKMHNEQINGITNGMNKLNFYYGKNPDADAIELRFNSSIATESIIDVTVRSKSGSVVGKSFIDMPVYKDLNTPIGSKIKDGYNKSLLKKSGKTVKLIDAGKRGNVEVI